MLFITLVVLQNQSKGFFTPLLLSAAEFYWMLSQSSPGNWSEMEKNEKTDRND